MNWFLISIKEKGTYNTNISIKEKIQYEFPMNNINEISFRKYNINSCYATNREINNLKSQFEEIVIIGDIKIHNKRELKNKYNFADLYLQTNESLISKMYRQKGINCIDDIIGEFSFVIIDQKTEKIYAVRDQVGIKPLFWIHTNDEYIFSSDIFLLRDFFNVQELNYSYFSEFYERDGIMDIPLTPFKNVNRIPSGHYMLIDRKEETFNNYWDLSNIKDKIQYSNESEYLDNFLALLDESVNSRIIEGNYNSVLLSGGLDSTSIYALSKKNNNNIVSSVSAVFDELRDCDERKYFEDLLKKYKDKGNYVNLDNKLMFEDFPNNTPFTYEPSIVSLSHEFSLNTAKYSVEKGLYNVLTGFGGDQLLTGSLYITRDFLKKLKFRELFSFLTDYSIYTNTSALRNMISHTLNPNIEKHFVRNKSNYYKYIQKKFKSIATYNQKELYFQISNAKAHLYLDRTIGGMTGADMNHPFLDRRLIEFVYKIPGNLRFTPTYSKYILRKSMHELLTPSIADRLNKTTHLAYTYKSLKKNWGSIIKVINNPTIVNRLDLISEKDWKENIGRWRNGLEVPSEFWTLLAIELWINKFIQRFG
ncbi:asparagine synthase-related protein [Priestia filamentosa]|uniref:asparagine synthase-related protein n=1 Tax=Priestia filamentosa TaxID=1402861 RepID=UPI003981D936